MRSVSLLDNSYVLKYIMTIQFFYLTTYTSSWLQCASRTLMEISRFSMRRLISIIFVFTSFHVLPALSFTSFVFGDSLVDAGNNDYLFTLSKADSPPYGIDFKPSGGQPTGRFTNGRTIPDIIGTRAATKYCCFRYIATCG